MKVLENAYIYLARLASSSDPGAIGNFSAVALAIQ